MKEKLKMKDSGKRQTFEGGAVRDTAEGKPQWSLLSPWVYSMGMVAGPGTYDEEDRGAEIEVISNTMNKLRVFMLLGPGSGECKGKSLMGNTLYDLLRLYGVERLCNWLTLGAEKYSRFNWSKGMNFSRVVDSLLRHLRAIVDHDYSEDHPAACCCNAMFLYHYLMEIKAGRMDPKWDDRFEFNFLGGPAATQNDDDGGQLI